MSIMKKVILIASSLAFFFACSEEKTEANYNRCPQASADDVVSTVQDVDGNQYKVVKIGDYEWFASNLKTTKLADGTAIANVTAEEDWANTTEPAYATYNNEDGAEVLYNYAAVQANPCPEGWYIPTDSVEWLQLAATYAGIENATGWDKVPTTLGWDSTSFAAKASGFRERNGKFYEEGNLGLWWTNTPHNEANAMYVYMKNISAESQKYVGLNKSHIGRTTGLSVRCVRKYDAANTYSTPEPKAVECTADTIANAIADSLEAQIQ
jgi:uncharacterized protein (TIGR02145 family)